MLLALVACDDERQLRPGPLPDTRAAIVRLEDPAVRIVIFPGPGAVSRSGRVSFTFAEYLGIGVRVTSVTLTTTNSAALRSSVSVPAAEAVPGGRVAGGARLPVSVPVPFADIDVADVAIAIHFTDDNGTAAGARVSLPVAPDVVGTWRGPMTAGKLPDGDWFDGRMTVARSGNQRTGEIVSRDNIRYPLTGEMSAQGVSLRVGNLPGTSTCSAVTFSVGEFEFTSAGLRAIAGRTSGRCFGTVGGTFELQRLTE